MLQRYGGRRLRSMDRQGAAATANNVGGRVDSKKAGLVKKVDSAPPTETQGPALEREEQAR